MSAEERAAAELKANLAAVALLAEESERQAAAAKKAEKKKAEKKKAQATTDGQGSSATKPIAAEAEEVAFSELQRQWRRRIW